MTELDENPAHFTHGVKTTCLLKGPSVQGFHTRFFPVAVTQGESRKLNQIRGGLLSNEVECRPREAFYRERGLWLNCLPSGDVMVPLFYVSRLASRFVGFDLERK